MVLALNHGELGGGEEALHRIRIRRPVLVLAPPLLGSFGGGGALILRLPLRRQLSRELRIPVHIYTPSPISARACRLGGGRLREGRARFRAGVGGVPRGALVDVIDVEGAARGGIHALLPT